MARRIGFIAAWVIATFATGLLAWGAVRIAGSQVADDAVRPLSAAQVAALPTTPAVPGTIAATGSTAATGGTLPAETIAAADDVAGPAFVPSPTTDPAVPPPATSAPSTATTAPDTTSTTSSPGTTTAAPASEVKTYHTGGGSVTIVVSPGVVQLGGASPAAGFTVDVEKDGPDKVEVKFESIADDEGDDYEFRAKWESGRLVVEID